jgi:hypothetical protein
MVIAIHISYQLHPIRIWEFHQVPAVLYFLGKARLSEEQ